MQFIDLKKQQDLIRHKINNRVNKVLDHGKYIMGTEVFELEDNWLHLLIGNIVFHAHLVLMHC